MGSLSNTYELNVLDAILGQGFTKPVTVYVALCTSAPTDSALGTEVSGGSYARAAVTNNATNWPNATTIGGVGTKSNGTVITFATPSGSWGLVTHFMLMDHLSNALAANMMGWGVLAVPRSFTNGQVASFAVNTLVVTGD